MKKTYLNSFCARCLTLLVLALLSTNLAWGDTYKKVTSITEGEYLIVNEASSRAFNGLDEANDYVSVTITNGEIADANGAAIVEIAAMDGGYSLKITNGDNADKYIYGKSGANSIQYGATAVANEITITDGAATILSNSTSFRYNSANGQDRFRYYKTTTTGSTYILPALYKKESTPAKTLESIAVKTAPSKTEYFVGDHFNPAGLEITATYDTGNPEVIAYAGNESKFTFSPALDTELQTSNTSVAITYGDKTCNQTITVSTRPAFTVTLSDTGIGLTESAPGAGVTLPSRSAVGDYKFEGWCETNVEETTTSPTIIPAENYQPSKNITLYPVYSKTISGTVSNDFQLVTDTPSDWSGEYIIVNSDKKYAMSCNFLSGTSGEFKAEEISPTGNIITSTNNEIIWTIEAGSTSGQYSIKNNSTGTYANITGTSSTNAALSTGSIYFSFESSSTDNVWKVVSVTYSARCFSYYGSNTSFRTYAKSGNNTGCLYKRKADGEVTYYVTLLPKNVEITAAGWATACLPFNATITSNNATAYYVTTSGSTLNKVEANVIPAGEGVLLKSNNGGAVTVTFTPSTVTADVVEANYMKGSVAGETFSADGYKYYILANDATNGLGFYFKVEGGASVECAAGKAVLAVPNSASPAKEGFPFDEEPTGIESIKSSTINHQSSIINLNGVRVNESYKGIIIVNGKKYINK